MSKSSWAERAADWWFEHGMALPLKLTQRSPRPFVRVLGFPLLFLWLPVVAASMPVLTVLIVADILTQMWRGEF